MSSIPVTSSNLDQAVATLADGFYNDPVWGWAFEDPARRREQQSLWFRIMCEQAIENGAMWTSPGGEAVTVWVPPGKPELSPEREAQVETAIDAACGARAAVLFDAFAAFDANHPTDRPHWYFNLFATAAAHRGHGHGMALLRADLERVDAVGGAAYLESTNPANNQRYRSVGFEPYGSFTVPNGGPVVTRMWREPRPPQ